MIDTCILTELKARKAKFGFKYNGLRPSAFIALGRLMEALETNHQLEFYTEMAGRDHNDFRLYTDSDSVADFIRVSFCIKLQKVFMAIKYHFIGWCREGGHDKVWGIIQLTEKDNIAPNGWAMWAENDYVTVWGRRGKTLQTKIYKDTSSYAMNQLAWPPC